jgi:hypothetical protein
MELAIPICRAWIAHYELVQAGLASGNNLQFQTWFAWGQGTSGTIETSQGAPTEAGNAYQQVYGWLVGNQTSPGSKLSGLPPAIQWRLERGGRDDRQISNAARATQIGRLRSRGA